MKRIHIALVGIVLGVPIEASTTKSSELAQKFAQIILLAKSTSSFGLTVLPSSRLRNHGARFVSEIYLLNTTVKSVGLERTVRELPNSTTTRIIRNVGEEWEARYERSDESTRRLARDANHNINRICELYEEIISKRK
ncbi:MAG: hypothetical protein HON43_00390 [Alphaproteobacteria bacterium]|jgi:hypothetical protein|nr:hypothetical protein [Alphaproteobacteria bacterium]MBT5389470.1 hypothetical protein [Alphaproteobacteria bacterium]